jgi:hypothetical protein
LATVNVTGMVDSSGLAPEVVLATLKSRLVQQGMDTIVHASTSSKFGAVTFTVDAASFRQFERWLASQPEVDRVLPQLIQVIPILE